MSVARPGADTSKLIDWQNSSYQVNCVLGCGAGGTQAHITSVTHITGSLYLKSQAGAAVTVTGTALDVNCTGCAAASLVSANQSAVWTIQAAHQGGQWNTAHVGSVTHVSGTIAGFGKQSTDVVAPSHTALRMTAVIGETLQRHVGIFTATSHFLAGVDGRQLCVYAYSIQSRNDSMIGQLVDNKTAHLTMRWAFNTREAVTIQSVTPPAYLFCTSPGNALQLHVTGAGTLDTDVSYWVK
jgi:hypothetical protein